MHVCSPSVMFSVCFSVGAGPALGIEGDDRAMMKLAEAKLGLTPHPILNSMMAINLFLTAKPGTTTKAGGQLH